MKLGEIVKNIIALYFTVWILILRKIRSVYHLDRNGVNFGVFLKLVGLFRDEETPPLSRSVSVPTMQRSTSIRERKRFLSDHGGCKKSLESSVSQNFVLKKKKETNTDNKLPNLTKMKLTCKRSLLIAKEEKRSR